MKENDREPSLNRGTVTYYLSPEFNISSNGFDDFWQDKQSRSLIGGLFAMIRCASLGLLAILVSMSMANAARSAEEPSVIQPEAAQVLRQMSDYLGSLAQFTFRADNTIDTVLQSGQQVQLSARVDIAIQRPSRFRVNRKGTLSIKNCILMVKG